MNSLYLFLAVGFGVVGVIVVAVIWSIRRMPSDAELDELERRQCAEAARAGAVPEASAVEPAEGASADR